MSETTAGAEFQQRVLSELAAIKADNEGLRAEMEELRATNRRSTRTGGIGRRDEAAGRRVEAGRDGISRSQFLRLGAAAAAAGAVGVGGAGGSLLAASPAVADAGTMQYGSDNNSSTHTTRLRSVHAEQTVTLLNESTGRGALVESRDGDCGLFAQGGIHAGVIGCSKVAGADPMDFYSAGVIGAGQAYGVVGIANDAQSYGVYAESSSGWALVGNSLDGISLHVGGLGRIYQLARGSGSPPAGHHHFKGEQVRDYTGEMWLCVEDGDPGVWRRAATVKEGYTGGSVNLLTKPIRIFDSRAGGGLPLAAGATRNISVTGIAVGDVQVPAGAKGVLGNITVVATGATGYLTLFPQGSPPSPVTASINWFAANQVVNTAAVVRLNPANGQMGVGNGLGGGSSASHFVFDATGFVF